jgi:hypothetical protein
MARSSSALAAALFAVFAGSAFADHPRDFNELLKGKFRFTFTQTCTYSQLGFLTSPPGGDVLGFAQSGGDYIDGIVKFDGNGNVTLTEKGVYQNHGGSSPGGFPIATYQDICAGTYHVNRDLSMSYTLACTVNLLTGFNAGKSISLTGLSFEGQLDRWGETFIVSSVAGAVQTMNFSDGFVNQRVCGANTIAIKIH